MFSWLVAQARFLPRPILLRLWDHVMTRVPADQPVRADRSPGGGWPTCSHCSTVLTLKLADVPEPDAGGNVLIDVHAAGVNFPDLLMTKGEYQVKLPPPFIPGNELARLVRSARDGSPFTAIVGFPMIGAYAETVAVPAAYAAPLPEELDFAEGAALVCNYQTVHFALHRRACLAEGETVMVLAAAGGVGTAAIPACTPPPVPPACNRRTQSDPSSRRAGANTTTAGQRLHSTTARTVISGPLTTTERFAC